MSKQAKNIPQSLPGPPSTNTIQVRPPPVRGVQFPCANLSYPALDPSIIHHGQEERRGVVFDPVRGVLTTR